MDDGLPFLSFFTIFFSLLIRSQGQSSFPRLIVVPLALAADKHEIDGVRKEKERLTAASSGLLQSQPGQNISNLLLVLTRT